jgi:hypothetical protein
MDREGFPKLTPAQLAEAADLALRAEHYASAFSHAAKVIRNRGKYGQTPEQIATWFEHKAQIEAHFAKLARSDPPSAIYPEY